MIILNPSYENSWYLVSGIQWEQKKNSEVFYIFECKFYRCFVALLAFKIYAWINVKLRDVMYINVNFLTCNLI